MYRLLIGLLCLLPLSAFAGGLVGLAYVDNIVGANLEWAWTHTSIYAVPGYRFSQSDGGQGDDVRWVAGMRHRMDGGRMDEDGFFMGLVAGDLGGTPTYRRFGAGGDLGYQLVRKYTRWTASAGLVMLNHDPKRNSPNEPGIVLAVSVSLRK